LHGSWLFERAPELERGQNGNSRSVTLHLKLTLSVLHLRQISRWKLM
jgi:hypothetical protein